MLWTSTPATSSGDVMAAADVVVVGGGLVGAATAFELARDGARVTLVDRHDTGRASDAGAGILSPETITDLPEPVMALVDRAGGHVADLVAALRDVGGPDPSYEICGSLTVATQPGEDDWFASTRTAATARHPGVLVDVDPAAARAMFPALGEIRSALFNPRAARIDGRAITAALTSGAQRLGVVIRHGSCLRIVTDGGRVRAVELADDTLPCGAVVMAGGAWTDELAAPFGVRPGVHPLRGQIVHLRLEGVETVRWPIVQPVLGFYAVPWPDGRIAIGGTMDQVGFDARPTADGLRQLMREGLRLAPGLADATFVEVRVGLRPMGEDGLPTIGAVPGAEGLFVATGLGTDGLLLGPLTGRLVADLVAGHRPPVDLDPLSPARWSGHA
jgi:D-amino-acid dehydrogenase